MPNTFADLGPFIQRYVETVAPAAIAEGAVVQTGLETSDRVRVKTGRNRKSIHADRGEARPMDPGAGQFPPPARGDLRAEIKGLKWKEDAALSQGTDYAAAREALDGAVEEGVAASRQRWKEVGEEAGRKVFRG